MLTIIYISWKLLKRNFHHPVFFPIDTSSLYQPTKESLAFIKATLHFFVVSITCALFNVDGLANFQK